MISVRTHVVLLFCGCLGVAGCSDSGPKLYPTTGSVKVDGAPAKGVILVLYPTDATNKFRPSGVTDEQGQFTLMTLKPNDGAPPGSYQIAASWPTDPNETKAGKAQKDTGLPAISGGENKGSSQDRLGAAYFDHQKSNLKCDIKAEKNQLPELNLKKSSAKPQVIQGA